MFVVEERVWFLSGLVDLLVGYYGYGIWSFLSEFYGNCDI